MLKTDELEGKRIAVLLSGGVDSSVVVYELVRQGLHPDCFYIKIGPEEEEKWDCSSEEDMEMATAVAAKYGCRLEVVDCHKEYWDEVTRYTINKVRAGMTPNPDVMCNRLIKFGAFHQKRGHDYDLIATGHYAQTELSMHNASQCTMHNAQCTMANAEEIVNRQLKWLTTSPDPVKDQTDFLAQIYDWQLQKAIFPIGHYMKDEVRQIAEREHLASARRKDSQGICFLGKINYNDYIRRYLGEQPGDVIELETGRRIGEHRGLWFHTVGQRKGMGFSGGPWFVVKKDVAQNVLYVSHGYDPATAYKQDFPIHDFHSINGVLPEADVTEDQQAQGVDVTEDQQALGVDVTIKIRHTPEYLPARLVPQGDGRYMVHAERPIHGVAPGQFCVIYDARHHRCYGSGEITV